MQDCTKCILIGRRSQSRHIASGGSGPHLKLPWRFLRWITMESVARGNQTHLKWTGGLDNGHEKETHFSGWLQATTAPRSLQATICFQEDASKYSYPGSCTVRIIRFKWRKGSTMCIYKSMYQLYRTMWRHHMASLHHPCTLIFTWSTLL